MFYNEYIREGCLVSGFKPKPLPQSEYWKSSSTTSNKDTRNQNQRPLLDVKQNTPLSNARDY